MAETRNGITTALTQRVTTRQAAGGQKYPQRSVPLNRFHGVFRTSGNKTTLRTEAEKQWAQRPAIQLNESDAKAFENPHEALLYSAFSKDSSAFVERQNGNRGSSVPLGAGETARAANDETSSAQRHYRTLR